MASFFGLLYDTNPSEGPEWSACARAEGVW